MNTLASRCVAIFGVIWCVIVASPALANIVIERPLQERMDTSSVVVVAEATQVQNLQEDKINVRYITMRVLTRIKGKPESHLRVLVSDGIAEHATNCCVLGKRYLLFLKASNNKSFVIVNFRYGAYEILD